MPNWLWPNFTLKVDYYRWILMRSSYEDNVSPHGELSWIFKSEYKASQDPELLAKFPDQIDDLLSNDSMLVLIGSGQCISTNTNARATPCILSTASHKDVSRLLSCLHLESQGGVEPRYGSEQSRKARCWLLELRIEVFKQLLPCPEESWPHVAWRPGLAGLLQT